MLDRSFEKEIPEFKSHDEARTWFKEKFGDNFFMVEIMTVDDQKLYRYHLVTDRAAYDAFQKKQQAAMEKQGFYALQEEDMAGFMSNNTVEIFEDGSIHIVY